ncbi:MAG: cellulose synthase catalytic subunit (UDP-forming) [Betaproteobacteria bacterium]|nr:cellulose synthase catalytic subunit (UDP-forming) [Betaproteobacteria bacterium]
MSNVLPSAGPSEPEPTWMSDKPGRRSSFLARPLLALAVIAAAVLCSLVVVVPLDTIQQFGFGLIMLIGALWVRHKVNGPLGAMFLIALSVTASLRYMYWRLTSTLDFDNLIGGVLGWGLLLAELYALAILLLGYVQTAMPFKRKTVPLPEDRSLWPTVDIFIPTYNESLDVVRGTVLAAQAMDWPIGKLRVYLLDDGRREEFRQFSLACGVGYFTRSDNLHAKAGNLNAALTRTDGEFVAIFDCDHVPTRSFLQLTMGAFLGDQKLAMLQTPHFFYSADPIERNLKTFRVVPNEAELFYGLVQNGNDLWNASFFCGSCAVLRRVPLMEVGGIAVETVTEDAHTSLKLSRRGYNSAYLAIPQAAGLATESLSAHIGQRIRWARGMTQIFRVDNPLLGPGLKLGQRLCYANAMLHFMYGLPRLVFMTSPLAYLFFGAQMFQADGAMVLAYALPHILLSLTANSRLQGQFRHSFWNEVYETVLAWYIAWPTLLALINPKFGKFNVTAKGGVIARDYFDWRMGLPYVVLLVLNLVGLACGLWRLAIGEGTVSTVLINLVWGSYNVVIAAAAVFVANEARQQRRTPRISAVIPATIYFANGRTLACETRDFSVAGVALTLPERAQLTVGEEVRIGLSRDALEVVLPGTVVNADGSIGVVFGELNVEQQRDLVQITFSRADSWVGGWGTSEPDKPLGSLRDVLKLGLGNLLRLSFGKLFGLPVRLAVALRPRSAEPALPPVQADGPDAAGRCPPSMRTP